MDRKVELKIIELENEHLFCQVVEDFVNSKKHIILNRLQYQYSNGKYVAFIEYEKSKEKENE